MIIAYNHYYYFGSAMSQHLVKRKKRRRMTGAPLMEVEMPGAQTAVRKRPQL